MPVDTTEVCNECGKEIDPETMVLLELHVSTHEWAEPGTKDWSDTEDSQGCWTFGPKCGPKVLKKQKCRWKGL